MSDAFSLPIVLDGRSISALVVGGGRVALRKVRALLAGGARVRVVAKDVRPELEQIEAGESRLLIRRGAYEAADLGEAILVIAATNDRAVNATVARDARRLLRLVVVADAPEEGNCVSPAVHRSADLVVAVTAGGVPAAAVRVRDAIAARLDSRYAAAVRDLSRLRARLLAEKSSDKWRAASAALLGEDFCESVEGGAFEERISAWQ